LQAAGTCHRKNVNLAVKIVLFDAGPHALATSRGCRAAELNNAVATMRLFSTAPFSTAPFSTAPRITTAQVAGCS